MVGRKERDVWQYGDFQTPPELAQEVCAVLAKKGIKPEAILEPTCGCGAFLAAAAEKFPSVAKPLGVEINPAYVAEARANLSSAAVIQHGDFFTVDWNTVLSCRSGPWLILGNPPWVTNAELSMLKSTNLPTKSNFQNHKGLDARTGKANFDISEWMLLRQLEWLHPRSGWIAMLVKTSVARKVLRQAWQRSDPIGRASIFQIDAMHHFGAAVDACLFILPVNIGEPSQDCDVFSDLTAAAPVATIGFHDGILLSDVQAYMRHQNLVGSDTNYVWRSGVKHDCSKVMELRKNVDGILINGTGEIANLEPDILYPLLKSSDVSKGQTRTDRFMIVTQRKIGEDTSGLAAQIPKTWRYLVDHADKLDARGSVIYRGKPRFSVFGVGAYTFAPWKIAISGFYKTLNFMKVGPVDGKPVVMDDTIYFLPCQSEMEADFLLELIHSQAFTELLQAMVFNGEKRPITAEILKRISFELVAEQLERTDEYAVFTQQRSATQLQLALG